jgi:hypothetical protein
VEKTHQEKQQNRLAKLPGIIARDRDTIRNLYHDLAMVDPATLAKSFTDKLDKYRTEHQEFEIGVQNKQPRFQYPQSGTSFEMCLGFHELTHHSLRVIQNTLFGFLRECGRFKVCYNYIYIEVGVDA